MNKAYSIVFFSASILFHLGNAFIIMSSSLITPHNKSLPRLILLDRDGVINHDVGAPGVLHPSQLILTNGAAKAISNFRNCGCKIAVITNQSCVGKGLIDEKNDLANIHNVLQQMLLEEEEGAIIDTIFHCTSLRESDNYRMKPNPGMIHEASAFFGIHVDECVMIGDTLTDLQAAASADVQCRILVETGYGLGIMNGEKAPSCKSGGETGNHNSEVKYIDDEYCGNREYNNNNNNNNTEGQKDGCWNKILPFYYAKDLAAASSWLLHNTAL